MNAITTFFAGIGIGIILFTVPASLRMIEVEQAHAQQVRELEQNAMPEPLRRQVAILSALDLPILKTAIGQRPSDYRSGQPVHRQQDEIAALIEVSK